jgi:sugar/nucleoside kinase (ribokinase family)
MSVSEYQYVTLGGMRQDYCITHDGQVLLGVLGGNAIYSAVGARLWSDEVGIVSRVGSDFPTEWLEQLSSSGFNTDGIHRLTEPHNTCTFYAYLSQEERVDTDPASHFLRIGQPLPKVLLDYLSSTEGQTDRDTFSPLAIRPTDLPGQISLVSGAHLAPAHYLTHTTVPLRLRDFGVRVVTLDPSERYMDPSFEKELPIIVSGLDAFLPSEKDAISYFRPLGLDIWEMAEAFGGMGCRFAVIKQGPRGQCIWDTDAKRRWHIPAYPAKVYDVTGAGDSFCGGFFVGLEQTGDAVEAALRGSVSASITIEGSGALYALDALPGLVHARLDALRPSVTQV